jgi:uncharacterized protein (DUF305 family)
MRVRLLPLAAIALLVATLHPMPARADAPAPDAQTARFEVLFMKGMIDHHTMAVAMSHICEWRARHSELRGLCRQVIEDQTTEIEMMRGWLKDWYGVDHRPRLTRDDLRDLVRLLLMPPHRFDREFLKMMIAHHQAALPRGAECEQKAQHTALVEMCHEMVLKQKAEIVQMQAWLAAWN